MGIKFKDLVSGCYYKGYDAMPPGGVKSFFHVISSVVLPTPSGVPKQMLIYCAVVRRGASNNWKLAAIQGEESAESLIKRISSESDVLAEGLVACPPQLISMAQQQMATIAPIVQATPAAALPVANVQPSGCGFPQTPPGFQPGYVKQIPHNVSVSSSTASSKAEKNIGKSVVQGNAYSEVCLRCGRPTRQIPMMRMYWCPECEPE